MTSRRGFLQLAGSALVAPGELFAQYGEPPQQNAPAHRPPPPRLFAAGPDYPLATANSRLVIGAWQLHPVQAYQAGNAATDATDAAMVPDDGRPHPFLGMLGSLAGAVTQQAASRVGIVHDYLIASGVYFHGFRVDPMTGQRMNLNDPGPGILQIVALNKAQSDDDRKKHLSGEMPRYELPVQAGMSDRTRVATLADAALRANRAFFPYNPVGTLRNPPYNSNAACAYLFREIEPQNTKCTDYDCHELDSMQQGFFAPGVNRGLKSEIVRRVDESTYFRTMDAHGASTADIVSKLNAQRLPDLQDNVRKWGQEGNRGIGPRVMQRSGSFQPQ